MKNSKKERIGFKKHKLRWILLSLGIGMILILSIISINLLSFLQPITYEGGNIAKTPSSIYRIETVNGHAGYIASILLDDDGILNDPFVFLLGYENEGGNGTYSELYYQIFAEYTGVDIIIFEYLDPSIPIQKNAENVVDFLGHLDSMIVGDYNLTLGGKSMGGIVARYVLAMTNNSVGIDKMFAIDAPNQGLLFSRWVYSADSTASIGKEKYQLIRKFLYGDAAFQLLRDPRKEGNPIYDEFMEELHGLEANNSYDPIPKIALTHTANKDNNWVNRWAWLHGKEHAASSYIEAYFVKKIGLGARIDFIPFSSAVDLVDPTIVSSAFSAKYSYASNTSAYYSTIVFPLEDTCYNHESIAFPQAEWDHFINSIISI